MKNYDRTDEDYFYGIKFNNVYRVRTIRMQMGQNAFILDGEFIKRHCYGSNNDIKGKNK
jgi:hypothetical protein